MKIKFTKEAVTAHLKAEHQMDLNTYEANYMFDFDWDQDIGKVSPPRRDSVASCDSMPGQRCKREFQGHQFVLIKDNRGID